MRNPFRRRRKTLSPDGLQVVEYPVTWQMMLGINGLGGSYAGMYKRQPSIRSVVDLIASQCAELTPKTYEKVPRSPVLPSGRLEVGDHPMAELLYDPRPGQDTYGFYYATFADIEVFDVAIWRKIRPARSAPPGALQRVPNGALNPYRDPVTLEIEYWTTSTGERIAPEDLVVFWGYDPLANFSSTPPMETLRQLLSDEMAAQANRGGMWRKALRKDGIIERDKDAPKMSDEARESFLIDLEDALAGADNTSRPAMLEPGMHWQDTTWSPREMEYISARRLTRVEVCSAYRVPPSAVAAHLQGKEMDEETIKILNQFTLPPRLARVESTIRAQLLPEFEKVPSRRKLVYVEFNLGTKLRGSFEDTAAIMASLAGGPVITVNEARARLNMPPIPGGDDIFVPLNSARGGGPQGSPQSPVQTPTSSIEPAGTTPGGGTTPSAPPQAKSVSGAKLVEDDAQIRQLLSENPPPIDEVLHQHELKAAAEAEAERVEQEARRAKARAERVVKVREAQARYGERFAASIHGTFKRQRPFLEGGGTLKRDRWDKELSDDLYSVAYPAVGTLGLVFASGLSSGFDHEQTSGYVRAYSDSVAGHINDQTERLLADGGDVEEVLGPERAATLGSERANWVSNWAPQEVVHQAGTGSFTKTWNTTSANPRPSHAAINGETVPYDEPFGNGLLYPGDPNGEADETAGCACIMDVEEGTA